MLSIIIPVYNRADLFEEALISLTNQVMKMFCVVVVDDASTEDIKSVCDKYSNKLTIIYLRQPINSGVGLARQRGLDWVISKNMDLLMFLDSDDILFPNATQALKYEINHGLFDYVASDIAVERKNGPQDKIEASKSTTWTHGKIYRVNYIKKLELGFQAELRTNEDLAFNLCISWNTKNGSYINNELYFWRDVKNSITRTDGELKDAAVGIDYIRAVYYAILFTLKNNSDFKAERVIPNLISCYNYYQMSLIKKGEVPEDIKAKLKELFSNPIINKTLSKKNIWIDNRGYIWSFFVNENKKVSFFQQTFGSWYYEFGGKAWLQ